MATCVLSIKTHKTLCGECLIKEVHMSGVELDLNGLQ